MHPKPEISNTSPSNDDRLPKVRWAQDSIYTEAGLPLEEEKKRFWEQTAKQLGLPVNTPRDEIQKAWQADFLKQFDDSPKYPTGGNAGSGVGKKAPQIA